MMAPETPGSSGKDDLRDKMKRQRSALDEASIRHASDAIVRHFHRLRYGISWLMYAPIHNEISTDPLFKLANDRRKDKVYFPRVVGEQLSFHRVKALSDLKASVLAPEPPSHSEVWDPSSASVIIVPGLAFSRTGDRLGYGRGFYDRFLAHFPHLPRLAVGYDFQLVERAWLTSESDQRMDFVITPAAVWGSPRVLN